MTEDEIARLKAMQHIARNQEKRKRRYYNALVRLRQEIGVVTTRVDDLDYPDLDEIANDLDDIAARIDRALTEGTHHD